MNPEGAQTIEDAIGTLVDGLPGPVRNFVTSPERSRIALSLSEKYNLHVDQAGEFERAYMFMLLGIASPEEFVDTLTKAGIPADTVRGLAKDVNEQVFVPLRKAEQAPPAPKQEAPAVLPGTSLPVPPPVPHRTPTPPLVAPPSVNQAPPAHPYIYGVPPMPQHVMYMPQYGMPYGPAPMYVWPQNPQPWPVPQGMPMEHLEQAVAATPPPELPRPVPQPRMPEVPVAQPLTKEYVADPYREGI
tara:strand:+ start:477666 stop:478397 length:732 start_codon:yes stop_codon:yes gene_type:complete